MAICPTFSRALGVTGCAVLIACSDRPLDRGDIAGSMWLAPVGDSTSSTRGHVLLEFAENTATLVPIYADDLRYVILRDTIVVFTDRGQVRFSFHDDSLTDETFGWVFYRAK